MRTSQTDSADHKRPCGSEEMAGRQGMGERGDHDGDLGGDFDGDHETDDESGQQQGQAPTGTPGLPGQMPESGDMPGRRGGMGQANTDSNGQGQTPNVGNAPQSNDGTNNGNTGRGESGTSQTPGMQQRSHSQSSGS